MKNHDLKIVVLDGYALNPGDLSWEKFAELGRLEVYDRTAPEDVVGRAEDADIILANKAPIPEDALAQLPRLRYIGVLATGYNNIDAEAAARQGIVVTNVPGYSADSVAQLVFAYLLEFSFATRRHDEAVHRGEWSASPDFTFRKSRLFELKGKTIGIVGFGAIGSQVCRIAQAFGMRVLACSRTRKQAEGVEWRDLDRLFAESDIVTLHCPLTRETRHLVHRERLRLMQPHAVLINTARGGLIKEEDLAEALKNNTIAGAFLDVLSSEPPQENNPLLTAPNCIITPHIGWSTLEARRRCMDIAYDNLRRYLEGKPVNVVSPNA